MRSQPQDQRVIATEEEGLGVSRAWASTAALLNRGQRRRHTLGLLMLGLSVLVLAACRPTRTPAMYDPTLTPPLCRRNLLWRQPPHQPARLYPHTLATQKQS